VEIGALVANYAAVSQGEFSCIFNSWGLLEIALNQGNAAQRTGAKIGDRLVVAVKE
jgi:S-adenosylmethionine hydrolase